MRFERTYHDDAEEVWEALTGDVDPVPDDSVVVAEAPSLLVCTAGDVVVRWKLARRGDGTRIVLTHLSGRRGTSCPVRPGATRRSSRLPTPWTAGRRR
jgi:hypothetical protein